MSVATCAPRRPEALGAWILAGALAVLAPSAARAADSAAFPPAETARIVAHGPWPQPATRDPSNRGSGQPAAIALGERLFFSPRLSENRGVLCSTCHEPWRAFTDGRPRAFGLEAVDRNTPTLVNVRLYRWFGWDGANDTLWAQSIRPLLDPREMASSAGYIAALVRSDPELKAAFTAAFGAPPADDDAVLAGVGKALAAYQETLATGRTAFDELRDAIERGDAEAAARYPAPAQRGLRIFIGKGNCASCHSGPNFTDGAFHNVGTASRRQNGTPDAGRRDGIRKLLANPFNLLGRYGDDPSPARVADTRKASGETSAAGAFRTPGLRDVALTAPYLHDGSLATLCEVAERHPRKRPGSAGRGQASLSAAERSDLVVFLETLTAAGPRLEEGSTGSCP
jgi:cytochrome c peroxidase